MSDLESEFQKLLEVYNFKDYEFSPASDDPVLSRMVLPERYRLPAS